MTEAVTLLGGKMLCVETSTCVLFCHCFCAITEILAEGKWHSSWMLKSCLFLFFVLRMKSSLAERIWAPCSSSTVPLPDDDSKHGWVVFLRVGCCMVRTYIYTETCTITGKRINTHTSHTSSGRNSTVKNNTCTRAERCEEAVNSSRWLVLYTLALFTLLLLIMLFLQFYRDSCFCA